MAEEVTFSACFTNDKALNTEAGMSSQFLLGIPWGAAAQRVGSHCPCAATPASSLQQRLDTGAVGAGMGCFTECCNSSFPFCLFSRSCGAGAQDAGLCASMGWSQKHSAGESLDSAGIADRAATGVGDCGVPSVRVSDALSGGRELCLGKDDKNPSAS